MPCAGRRPAAPKRPHSDPAGGAVPVTCLMDRGAGTPAATPLPTPHPVHTAAAAGAASAALRLLKRQVELGEN